MVSANDMWEMLALSHEECKEVRRNKITMQRTQYEIFTIEVNMSIQSMITRLQTIPNNLGSLSIVMSQSDINDKVLGSLPLKWIGNKHLF